MLAAPDRQAAIERALARLAGTEAAAASGGMQGSHQQQAQQQAAGLPTMAQLRYACCHLAAESALQVAALAQQPLPAAAGSQERQRQALTPDQREAVQAAEDGSINELMELEPGNPRSLVAAALACGRSSQPPERVAGLYLSAHRLAAEQRSDWWMAVAASRALAHAAERPGGAGVETLAEAVAAFRQAEPALKTCRRQLPAAWVQQLDAGWAVAERLLPAAQRAVAVGAGAAAEGEAAAAAAAAAATAAAEAECGYCGKPAALRCSRCRSVAYCSRECQRAAHPQHKQRCRPAA